MTVPNDSDVPPSTVARGSMIHRAVGEEVAVYRLFDSCGQLLYVGISKDPLNRWQEHVGKSWWTDVAEYEVLWHDTRAAAREAEKGALANEGPVHNIHSTPRHGAHWKALVGTPEAREARAAWRRARAAMLAE